jgi:teichuronic acid biosynthesis glycosyltransferase TuaG
MSEVSVIIPTWNRAGLLVAALRSALAQTVPPLEVLVCDDGSTDGSEEAVQAVGDVRVRWLPGPRGGRPAIPRNRGIRESRGEWVAFLDNDDEWRPDKLERQLRLAGQLGCRAACSNASRFIPGAGNQGDYLSFAKARVCFDDLLAVNQVICSSALIHRSVLDAVAGFPEEAGLKALEDYALWLRVAVVTDFAYCPVPLVVYRDDAGSSVRKEGMSVWQQRRAVFSDFLAWGKGADVGAANLGQVRARRLRDRFERSLDAALRPVRTLRKALRQ